MTPLAFASPQEEKDYNNYFAQIQKGFSDYGMSDPFSTGAPQISPTGSITDWFGVGGKFDQWFGANVPGWKALTDVGDKFLPTTETVKSVYSVAAFLTDLPRLLVTVLGFALILFGLMQASNRGIQVLVQGAK